MKQQWYTVALACVSVFSMSAKVVSYSFDIDTIMKNYTGKSVEALAINGQIPAPTIEATIGDTLEVTFHNKMNKDTSVHWHGILLPNDQDGVPYLTTPPIKARSSFTYRFQVKQAGTYWYHSHTGLQEQRGLYGALIFHPKGGERVKADREYVVVLSDWTNERPKRVLSHLKRDGDFYALKKRNVLSWDRVLKYGMPAINNRLKSAVTRMGPMDISDVGYDAFLANGEQEITLDAKPGEKIRLRLINAGASSYFNVEFAGAPMTIVAADGPDVEPQKVKRLLIAIAETYDVIVDVIGNKSYELRATSEDGTGFSSTFIGAGAQVFAPDIPRPNLFLRTHDMQMKHDTHEDQIGHDDHVKKSPPRTIPNIIDYMTDYEALRSIISTQLPSGAPERVIHLDLTGNMARYTWSFDNKILVESDKIVIKKGENVRIIMDNHTMMHHPIHLHGHFFRVLNGQREKSPLKHTVNVPSMQAVTVEFAASEEKDWFLHCHNLYHMQAGMAGVVAYEETTTATRATFAKIIRDAWYFAGDIAVLSHMDMGILRVSTTRNALEVEFDNDYGGRYEVDALYLRNINFFLDLYVGTNFQQKDKDGKHRKTATFGLRWILPLLVELDVRLDARGKFRLEAESSLQLTARGRFEWFFNTDEEYRAVFSFEANKYFIMTVAYDSHFKWGAGFRARF